MFLKPKSWRWGWKVMGVFFHLMIKVFGDLYIGIIRIL